jgi:hypothetical protein
MGIHDEKFEPIPKQAPANKLAANPAPNDFPALNNMFCLFKDNESN